MKIERCMCEWCNEKSTIDFETVEELAQEMIESSGPFDDSDEVHILCVAVLKLLKPKPSWELTDEQWRAAGCPPPGSVLYAEAVEKLKVTK